MPRTHEKYESVLECFKNMRNDTWACRCPAAQPEWMDWLIESWERMALDDLKMSPEGFTDRDIDACYYVASAWEGVHCGRWEMAINTMDRKGHIQSIDNGRINYPRGYTYELDSDLAWFDFLLEIRRVINMTEQELLYTFGISPWWAKRYTDEVSAIIRQFVDINSDTTLDAIKEVLRKIAPAVDSETREQLATQVLSAVSDGA